MPRVLAWSLLAACVGGCTWGVQPAEIVDSVDLQALPAAINIDSREGADAVQTMVYLYELNHPKPGDVRTVVAEGTLEMMMFDGKVPPEQILTATPMQVFRFTAQELALCRTRNMAGVAYGLQLAWTTRPKAHVVTLVARYNQGGRTLYSAPVIVAVEQE